MFAVEDYLKMLEEPNIADVYSTSILNPIGGRGLSLIAAYSDLYKSDAKQFIKQIDRLPVVFVRSILKSILETQYKNLRDNVLADAENILGSEDKLGAGIVAMAAGGSFVLTVVLPESKKEVEVSLFTERNLNKMGVVNRYKLVTACVKKVGGDLLTKEGADKAVSAMDYKDFEYLYAMIDFINVKIGELNWETVIKNF